MVKLGVKSDTALLIDLHYLPCIEFFTYLQRFDKIIIEAQENYQKQSYRNRCRIMGPNRVLELSVPVLKPSGKTKIKEVRIDNHQNWIQRHWRGLRASYGRAPFFEFFSDEFYQPLTKPHIFLFDLNLLLLHTTLQVLGIDKEIELSASYQTEASSGTFDARARIHPQCEYDHNGYYRPTRYNQIFGKEFVANLSIVDLIFCEGTNAYQVLQQSFRNQKDSKQ